MTSKNLKTDGKKSVTRSNQPIHRLERFEIAIMGGCRVRFLDIYREITKIATNDCVVRHFFCHFVVNSALTPNSHASSSPSYRGRSIGVSILHANIKNGGGSDKTLRHHGEIIIFDEF